MPEQEVVSSGATRDLARFVVTTEFSDEVRQRALEVFVDTVGVLVAGLRQPDVRTLAKVLRLGTDPSDGVSLNLRDRALLAGTAAHVLDLDDDEPGVLIGHATAAPLCALLSQIALSRSSGAEVLDALVAGIEVEIALGRVLNPSHYDAGWHATSTIGVIGAAAACARLMGLETEETAMAIGMAASCSAGVRANFGTSTKPLHVGWAAQNGFSIGHLVHAGLTASPEALEAEGGLFATSGGRDRATPVGLPPGGPWGLLDPGLSIKQYPSCSNTHPAIDAALALRSRVDGPDDIADVECRVAIGTSRLLRFSAPATGLEAKFSLEHCVAVALVRGEVWTDDFTDEAVQRTDINDMRSRVTVVEEARSSGRQGVDTSATLRARCADGRVLEEIVLDPLGSPANPTDRARIGAKFIRCVEPVLGPGPAKTLLDKLWDVEAAHDAGDALSAVLDAIHHISLEGI